MKHTTPVFTLQISMASVFLELYAVNYIKYTWNFPLSSAVYR